MKGGASGTSWTPRFAGESVFYTWECNACNP